MFAMKIAFARLLSRVVVAMAAAQRRLASIEYNAYNRQLKVRTDAEHAARASRRAETELARKALARLVETQQADERAITRAAWKN